MINLTGTAYKLQLLRYTKHPKERLFIFQHNYIGLHGIQRQKYCLENYFVLVHLRSQLVLLFLHIFQMQAISSRAHLQ